MEKTAGKRLKVQRFRHPVSGIQHPVSPINYQLSTNNAIFAKNLPMDKEYTDELLLDFGSDGDTLIPVITQDFNSGKVLILAYANRNAFRATIESGYATFYSRSRKVIWKKGLTSGNFLKVIEIRINCEQNSLLYMVTQQGPGACHAQKEDGTPHETCFYRRIVPCDKLEIVAEDDLLI